MHANETVADVLALWPGMTADDREAHARAQRAWSATGYTHSYVALFHVYRRRIELERTVGISPFHPHGEDGHAAARPRPLATVRFPLWPWLALGAAVLVGTYLVAINW